MTSKARHEFQSLKGIIRLQAVVRGRLVQRQVRATLFCIQGIVKFQAIARGHMVRKSSNDNEHCRRQILVSKDGEHQDSHEINKYSPVVSLSKNAFIYEVVIRWWMWRKEKRVGPRWAVGRSTSQRLLLNRRVPNLARRLLPQGVLPCQLFVKAQSRFVGT